MSPAERAIADALAYRILRDAPGVVTSGDGSLETEMLAYLVDALAPVVREAIEKAFDVLPPASCDCRFCMSDLREAMSTFAAVLRGEDV